MAPITVTTGWPRAQRVYGPDLMLAVCRQAESEGMPIALFGGTAAVLRDLSANLLGRLPRLRIAAAISPAFGIFSEAQNADYAKQLSDSGAQIVFVGLGCPKQERWMSQCRSRISAVLVGVGAAFNFHAGRVRQAPAWLQRAGLEWAFRFAMEPARLWRRYLWHNPRFILAIAGEEWRRLTGVGSRFRRGFFRVNFGPLRGSNPLLMAKIENLQQLFIQELQILLSGEDQLVAALPRLADAAHDPDLQAGLTQHLEETRGHAEKVRKILSDLGAEEGDIECPAMQGLIAAGETRIELEAPDSVRDSALIIAAQRVEHFEIAGYGAAVELAALLGHSDFEDILAGIEAEEAAADEKLSGAAEALNAAALALAD